MISTRSSNILNEYFYLPRAYSGNSRLAAVIYKYVIYHKENMKYITKVVLGEVNEISKARMERALCL